MVGFIISNIACAILEFIKAQIYSIDSLPIAKILDPETSHKLPYSKKRAENVPEVKKDQDTPY